MGDIWPCQGPVYVTWQESYNMIYYFTHDATKSDIMAAIGQAESGNDISVINDTPQTGDYSVGEWQVNYYGSLNGPRTAQFGTPCALIRGGLGAQARAALAIQAEAGGYTPWSTYNNGAYRKYLHGAVATSPPPSIGPSPWIAAFQVGLAAYYVDLIEPAGKIWRQYSAQMPPEFWARS